MYTALTEKIFTIDSQTKEIVDQGAGLAIGRWCVVLLFLQAYGYSFTASILTIARVNESTTYNVVLRSIYALIAITLIVKILMKYRIKDSLSGGGLILGFWLIYSIRFIYDVNYLGISLGNQSEVWMYSFAFGAGLLPAVAMIFAARFAKDVDIAGFLFWGLLLTNVLLLIVTYNNQESLISITNQRNSLAFSTNEGDYSFLNPITISQTGGVLCSLSLGILIISTRKIGKIWLILGILIGGANLLLGASKGPFIAWLVACLVIIFSYLRRQDNKPVLRISIAVIVVLAFLIGLYYAYNNDFVIFSRFEQVRQGDEVALDRTVVWQSALQQFYDNPIIGDMIICTYNMFYPHNLYIEVLMATGVIGGVLFFSFIIKVLIKLGKEMMAPSGEYGLAINIIACLIIVTSSGCLYTSVDFWSLIPFYLCSREAINA